MKVKADFITNSSSTAFYILNKTNEVKTLVDFVKENPELIEDFIREYGWYKNDSTYTQENLLKSAEENNCKFDAKRSTEVIFGDEDGTLIGHVFDYILRYGGESKSFKWRFKEYLR